MKHLLLIPVLVFATALTSCNKDEQAVLSSADEAILSNEASGDAIVEASDYEVELFTGSTESYGGGQLKSAEVAEYGSRYRNGQLPEITVSNTEGTYPVTITIDYGTGIELMNGTVIKGKIIVVLTAQPRTDGAVRTVTFDGFYIDSVNIAGTRTLTFSSTESGNKVIVVGDITLTFADGVTIERDTEKIRVFTAGWDTPRNHTDDRIEVTGFTTSVSSEGYSCTATIQSPLIITGECRYIVQGTVSLQWNNGDLASIDYGNGTCENVATITKDGVTEEIIIGKRFRYKRQ